MWIIVLASVLVVIITTLQWTFLKETIRHFRTTGALIPSSARLARKATEQIRGESVLLVGCGTGAILSAILDRDDLKVVDVVEINENFVRYCSDKYKDARGGITRFFYGDFLKFQFLLKYDTIITTVPHKNLPNSVVKKLCWKYREYGKRILMFEYYIPFFPAEGIIENIFNDASKTEFIRIFLNIPPIRLRVMDI